MKSWRNFYRGKFESISFDLALNFGLAFASLYCRFDNPFIE